MRLCVYFGLLMVVGCGGTIPRPDNYSADPERLLVAIQDRDAAVKSITAELAVEVWLKNDRIKGRQMMAADSDGRLRIDVLTPFGQPLSTLVSDGARIILYSMRERRVLIGPATPENLNRLIPIQLSPEELSKLMRGVTPLIKHQDASVSWQSDRGRYVLTVTAGSVRQVVEMEPEHLRVTSIEKYSDEQKIYQAKLGQYTGTGDAILPRRIRFEVTRDALKVDLVVKESRVNPTLPEAAFHLDPPRGIPIEEF